MSRVGSLIRYHVTRLLLEASNDERLQQVTITDVVVNRDTTRAEIFYSMLGTAEERADVQAALDKAAGWLRAELAPVLRLRNLPQLVFVFDPSLAQGERIEALLSQLQAEGALQPAVAVGEADGTGFAADEWETDDEDSDDEWDEDTSGSGA